MGIKKGTDIRPATGKLGILLPGMGAVATTFIAGVEHIRRGYSKPIGSLTQMGTIRLGKRTEGRSPLIRDAVPLASIDDIVFGAWDPFPDDAYTAALRAGAAAILGRPVSLEALAGALLSTRTAQAARATQAASAGHVGLGEADRRR